MRTSLKPSTAAYTDYLATLPEPVRIFSEYTQRGAHDLYHVLGGYGRDELGEACVVAMGYEQLRVRGSLVIAKIGPFAIRRYLSRADIDPKGVRNAVREARARGKNATWLPGIGPEAFLSEQLSEVRARLNLPGPVAYEAVLRRYPASSKWREGSFATLPRAKSGRRR